MKNKTQGYTYRNGTESSFTKMLIIGILRMTRRMCTQFHSKKEDLALRAKSLNSGASARTTLSRVPVHVRTAHATDGFSAGQSIHATARSQSARSDLSLRESAS